MVNNIKDELKDFLTNSNKILLSCEKIQELAEKYERKSHNDIKTLYYISEIYKNKELAEEFLKKKIKNLDIAFRYDKYIKSENYYFNGMPIPKDVKALKKGDQLYISWDIDDSLIKYFDTKDIKYSVLIKENDDNSYDRYSTDNKYFYYKYYYDNRQYDIKVQTQINYDYSECSEGIVFKYEEPL